MIKPSVGRVVLFVPGDSYGWQMGFSLSKGGTYAALVTAVHSDRMVNLSVFDANGKQFGRTSVTLCQPEDEAPPSGDYCRWMDYQVGQAAKTQELAEKVTMLEGLAAFDAAVPAPPDAEEPK